jgi:hypothetical protein
MTEARDCERRRSQPFEQIMTEVIASRKDERQRPAPDLGFELE